MLVLAASLWPSLACAADPAFDADLAAGVFTSALSFMAPRTLDPLAPGDLAIWGLHGIAALDPNFATTVKNGELTLSQSGKILLHVQPAPATDAVGWGRIAANINDAAFTASPTLKRAGQQALVQSFFDEIFNHLDSYSRYVPPTPAEAARDRLAIDASAGINLMRRPKAGNGDGVMISDIVPGGPAEAADLRVGDRLIAIDGQSIAGHKLATIRDDLTGEEGQTLTLRVRGLNGKLREVVVTLAPVPPETVFASRMGRALLVRVSAFTANTAERLSQALEAGLLARPSAVIVDLRGNRGGLVRQAVTSVALFAETGVVASTAGRAPEATHDWRIEGGDLTRGLPVILLVDGNTASAAEIMAASLADLGRGVVVGSATLGKGLVQTLTRLPDGGELFLTWSRVLAPRHWPLQTLGVIPQICTSIGEDDIATQLDALADGDFTLPKATLAARATRAPLPAAKALDIRAACPAAEGTDADLMVARYLATHPDAYAQALIP